jgi:hypothetical protein
MAEVAVLLQQAEAGNARAWLATARSLFPEDHRVLVRRAGAYPMRCCLMVAQVAQYALYIKLELWTHAARCFTEM